MISVEIMKTIDDREMQKTTKHKHKKAETSKEGTEAILKEWELNDFVVNLK